MQEPFSAETLQDFCQGTTCYDKAEWRKVGQTASCWQMQCIMVSALPYCMVMQRMHSTKWPSDQHAARCQGQDSDHSLGRSRECGTCSLHSASSSEAQNSTCWTCRGSKELVDCASLFGMVQSEIVSSAE